MANKTGWTRRAAMAALGAGAAACGSRPEAPAYEGVVRFEHGIASGDPRPDRVIIWTRVSPEIEGPVPVRWVVARNRELTEIVRTDVVETSAARDYTVKVDVEGLRAGAPYFYGFLAGDQASQIGRMRTLNRGRLDELKIAVASCASFPHGFFNAYEAIADIEGLDLVVHLGDYIYEYGLSGYGGQSAIALGRIPRPEVECVDLEDYRQRHAQAKTEPELQAAHAACPWVVVWDDHETANDSWATGAENHSPDANEGDWNARKGAALQAYYEWMPIREPEPGQPLGAINRAFQFGDLCTLIMLESRLGARTKPFDYATETPLVMQAWDFTNPQAPVPAAPGASGAQIRVLPIPFEEVGGDLRPVRDWGRVGAALADPRNPPAGLRFMPDLERLNEILNAPERVMLGDAQHQWLAEQLSGSTASNVTWQLLGNQVLMAPVLAPDVSRAPAQLVAQLERVRPGASALLGFTRYEIPLNPDAWDGYPAARARVLAAMRAAGGNPIVVTGDSHSAWANELEDQEGRLAVEFGATSITSPSDAEYFTAGGFDFAAALRARNPHIKWTDQTARGFLLLTLTKRQAMAEFFKVSTVQSKDYELMREAAFTIAPLDGPGIGAITSLEE